MTKKLKYTSAFDIIGPIMVGPSSSHTAGVVKIGQIARKLYNRMPTKVTITFFGSFSETYKGHGTAVAIIAGILGYEASDERIPDAVRLAEEKGITIEFIVSQRKVEHSNTVTLFLESEKGGLNLTAISIGGGKIQLRQLNQQSVDVESNETGIIINTCYPEKVVKTLGKVLDISFVRRVQLLKEETIILISTFNDISYQHLVDLNNSVDINTAIAITS